MRHILTFVFLSGVASCLAQRISISQSAELLIPAGIFKQSANTGVGTTARLEVAVKPKFTVTASAGYGLFGKKTLAPNYGSVSTFAMQTHMVPLQIGCRFYPLALSGEKKGLYFSGETGVHILGGTVYVNNLEEHATSSTSFSFAYGLGFRLNRFDVGARQQFTKNDGQSIDYVAVRVDFRLWASK